MPEMYWEIAEVGEGAGGYNINGIPIDDTPVQYEHPFVGDMDIERFIMGLPFDEAKVLVARMLGFQGEEAAQVAGMPSIWIYVRQLRKLRKRARNAKELAW